MQRALLLSVSNLNVCIDGKKIVGDVSLEVEEGELHVIIGPNGSGKSTLLSAIMVLPHSLCELFQAKACK